MSRASRVTVGLTWRSELFHEEFNQQWTEQAQCHPIHHATEIAQENILPRDSEDRSYQRWFAPTTTLFRAKVCIKFLIPRLFNPGDLQALEYRFTDSEIFHMEKQKKNTNKQKWQHQQQQ